MAQGTDARLAAESRQVFSQGFWVDQVALVGVVDRSLECNGIEFGPEINKRLRRGGDRNVIPDHDVIERQARPTVKPDAGTPQFAAPSNADHDPVAFLADFP